MKEFFKEIKADKITSKAFFITFLIVLLSIIYCIAYYRQLPPLIPLYNQLPWGTERIADTYEIFIPIAIEIFIFIFNLFFSALVYKKAAILSRIFSVTSLLFAVLIFLFLVRTIQIVI